MARFFGSTQGLVIVPAVKPLPPKGRELIQIKVVNSILQLSSTTNVRYLMSFFRN
jgi:hypothetical protein